jgi:tetrahydromethanopterin S-methyltransferase subunit F
VVAADDVTEVDRLAEYQPRPVRPPERAAAGAKPDAAPPAAVMASRNSTSHLLVSVLVTQAGCSCRSSGLAQLFFCVSLSWCCTQQSSDADLPCSHARVASLLSAVLLCALQAGPAVGSPSAAAGGGAGVVAGGGGVLPAGDPEEARRQEVLQRLQGRDTQLESGLKVCVAVCALVSCVVCSLVVLALCSGLCAGFVCSLVMLAWCAGFVCCL